MEMGHLEKAIQEFHKALEDDDSDKAKARDDEKENCHDDACPTKTKTPTTQQESHFVGDVGSDRILERAKGWFHVSIGDCWTS